MNEFNIENNIKVEGKIELISSMIISSGEAGAVNQIFIRDYKGRPIIPGTSITGVLRNISKALFDTNEDKFWGYVETDINKEKEELISQVYINDATITGKSRIEVRNNVAINRKTHTAIDKYLFDYETLSPGTKFNFSMELRQEKYDEELEKIFYTLIKLLESGKIALGAKTNNGLGKIRLIDTKINSYNLTDVSDIKKWLDNASNSKEIVSYDISKIWQNDLIINAEFIIASSLLIKTYNSHPDDVDSSNFRIGKDYYIPGSSIKGVIRSRMERIVKTTGMKIDIEKIFGFVDEDKKTASAGHISFNEIKLENTVNSKQTRIKIDKFTGSTIKGALFASNVIWNTQNDTNIKLEVVLKDYNAHRIFAAVLMLALKDLWDSDLAVGSEQSIGRGRLIGKSILVSNGDRSIEYTDNGLSGDRGLIDELETSLMEVNK